MNMEAIKVYTYDDDPTSSVLIKLTRTDVKSLKHILECGTNEPPEIFSLHARDTIWDFAKKILAEVEK